MHDLEVAPVDQSAGAEWGCFGTLLSGADGTAIGTGAQNSEDIADGCSTAGIAAVLALEFTLNGYDDWFLSSQDEFSALSQADHALVWDIGGFSNDPYWSPTEVDLDDALGHCAGVFIPTESPEVADLPPSSTS